MGRAIAASAWGLQVEDSMRHLRSFAVVAMVFFSFASPAAAQGLGRGWLERLSGPGPFDGFNYHFSLGPLLMPIKGIKIKLEKNALDKASVKTSARTEAEKKALEKEIDERPLCRACLDVEFSDFANYPDDRPQNGLMTITSAQFLVMVPITAMNLRGALEVGGGLGWAHFRGDTFDFKKPTVPVRATVKPGRFIKSLGRRTAGVVQIVIPVLIFPHAIRPADFTKRDYSFEPDHFIPAEHAFTLLFDASSFLFGR